MFNLLHATHEINIRPGVKYLLSLTLTILLFSGCTTAVKQTAGRPGGNKVRVVQVDHAGLSADSLDDFRDHDIARKLQAAVNDQLSHANKLDPKGATLVVTVTDLRIHSTSAVVWAGMMAGRDKIIATARVVQNGKTEREFSVATKRAADWMWGAGVEFRVKTLCQHIAEELARSM